MSFIKDSSERLYYLACPEENCRKKVIESEHPGKYRCDTCNKLFDTCVPTYMLLARVADLSDSLYINFYRGQAEAIMGGHTAEQMMKWKEDSE